MGQMGSDDNRGEEVKLVKLRLLLRETQRASIYMNKDFIATPWHST